MYLQKHLSKDFSIGVRERGALIHTSGQVSLLSGNQWRVSANVRGARLYRVELSRQHDEIHVQCDCPFFGSAGACKHIWAAIVAADANSYLLGAFGAGKPRLVEDYDEADFSGEIADDDEDEFYPEAPPKPYRSAAPQRVKPPAPPAWRNLLQQLNAQPTDGLREEQWRSDREIYYIIDAAFSGQGLSLRVEYRERTQTGKWGKLKAIRASRGLIREIQDPRDREALTMLAGASHPYYSYVEESIPSECQLKHCAPEILLPKICATGRCRLRTKTSSLLEELPALRWDDGEAWGFRLVVERQGDKWVLLGILRRGDERMDLAEAAVLLPGGILIARGAIARFDHGGAFPWIVLLRKETRIQAPIAHGPELVAEILRGAHPPQVDLPQELRFEEVTPTPRPILKFYQPNDRWIRNKLRGRLSFDYAGEVIPFETYSQGVYKRKEKLYLRRDAAAERAAIETLNHLGLKTRTIFGEAGPQWEVGARKLPDVVRQLVETGWRIEAEGKTFRPATGFRTALSSGIDWFELHGAAEYGDIEVKLPELLKALERGDQLVSLGGGSYGILPEDFLKKYGLLARLGRAQDDHVRFSGSQAGLLDALLAARPEIQVDEVFTKARDELRRFNGIEPATQPAGFAGELRGYQCEGLAWMCFLQRLGFGGCLADDMGVGKTAQVLALLETRRELRQEKAAAIGPSLAVVPRSLVYNWRQEAARFTPRLRVLDQTGAGREKGTQSFQDYDLILATYGTLRRDAALLHGYRFDYVILDEAQAIKNAGSESAKAARLLQADHRLALSGTPIENHLGELWSLLEFLNPGMLGAASLFRGVAGSLRNPDEETRGLLAKALRPYILRRTKAQAAPELPEKLEQTIYCDLDSTQRKLYDELREHYRQALLSRIDTEGMAKSKIQILEALLRLRQAACHPGLIDKQRTRESSAKMEALIPELAEVMEEDHKALVFSQFTSLLAILREHLDRGRVPYEYLDGKTVNRQLHIERFQSDPGCKLFLISLKAGGLGLNLTAAEYVFLLDPWWNPAVEAQAIDRTHRIGQSRPVFAYRLIARDTVEEKVLELQKSKRALADAIIGEDNRLLGNLKREDLELLLS